MSELSEIEYAFARSPTGRALVSGDSVVMLRWWDVRNRCYGRIRDSADAEGEFRLKTQKTLEDA